MLNRGSRTTSRNVSCGLLALAGLAGCSGHQAPLVRVGDAALVEVADEALAIGIAIELENPNAEPLELRRLTYTLSIDGRTVYDGRRAAQATLARSGVKTITIPAVVRYDRVSWDETGPPAEAEWSVRGEVVYVTPDELGEILLDARIIEPKAAFGGGGVVRISN